MTGSVLEPRFTGEGHSVQNGDHGEGPMAVLVLQRRVVRLMLEPLRGTVLLVWDNQSYVGTPVEFAVN